MIRKFNIASILSVLCLGLFFSAPVFALTVSPVKIEISGDPDQTLQDNLLLINEQNQPQKLYSSFANFEAKGESGNPYFVPATDGLGTWITVPSEIDLMPGEQKSVPFTITIPKTATSGGYYAAIFWGTTPPLPQQETQQQVSISGRLGILVLLTVNGPIKYEGGLLGFNIVGNKNVFEVPPVLFEYRFSNDGSDRINLQGDVVIKNMLGGVATTMDANPDKGNILPNTIRKFTITWQGAESESNQLGFFAMAQKEWNNFHMGKYNAVLTLHYGDKTVVSDSIFFLFPWQLLLIIFTIFLMIGVGGFFGVRKYNRWIISGANHYKQ